MLRGFRQLHLSTALLLTLAAAALLWLNLRPNLVEINSADGRPYWNEFGWPFVAYEAPTRVRLTQELMAGDWYRTSLLLDICIGVLTLLAAAVWCEWFTRDGRRDPAAARPWYLPSRAGGVAALLVLVGVIYLNARPHMNDIADLPENLMVGRYRGWPFDSYATGQVIFVDHVEGVLDWPKQNLLFWKPFLANAAIGAALTLLAAWLGGRLLSGRAKSRP